jgi:hypothetical protein
MNVNWLWVALVARENRPPHWPHSNNPEIDYFSIFRMLIPNLFSKILY